MHLLLGEALVVLHILVARAQLVLGRLLLDLLPHIGVAQDAGARLRERRLHFGIFREILTLGSIGQEAKVDRPIQEHAVDLRQRHLAILLGQAAGERLDLAAAQLGTIDHGHDRVVAWGGLLRVNRQAQRQQAKAECDQPRAEHDQRLHQTI